MYWVRTRHGRPDHNATVGPRATEAAQQLSDLSRYW